MAERLVTVAGVRLCVETFGVPAAPALLLIGGAAASMDWWDVEFCTRLADEGRFVIRYDHRDTGRSEVYPVGEPAYSGADLATDPLRVLDALGIARAHVVGLSMGGGIAQQLAAHHPDRLLTATLIATSAAGERVDQTSLPPMDARLAARFAEPAPQPAWHDRAAVVDYLVEGRRAYAGSLGFDEDRVRRLATIVADRTRDIAASMTNHWTVAGGASARFRLARSTFRQWFCTAPLIRYFRSAMARPLPRRYRAPRSCHWKEWGTRCPRRSCGTSSLRQSCATRLRMTKPDESVGVW